MTDPRIQASTALFLMVIKAAGFRRALGCRKGNKMRMGSRSEMLGHLTGGKELEPCRVGLPTGADMVAKRPAIQSAILELADGAKAARVVIDVTKAAIWLSSRYPQSGFTIEEIEAEIARAARARQAPLSGSPEPPPHFSKR